MADATKDDASNSTATTPEKSFFKSSLFYNTLLQNLRKSKKKNILFLDSNIIFSWQWDLHPPCRAHFARPARHHARHLHQDLLLQLEAQVPVKLGHEMRAAPAVDDFAARLAY